MKQKISCTINLKQYLNVIIALMLILLISCERASDMDYIPTPAQIGSWLPEFISDGGNVEGLYGNMDIDSVIFRYTLNAKGKISANDILSNIIVQAEKEGWVLVVRGSENMRFNRFRPSGNFFSSEDIRVVFIPKNLRVYVAWVQADSSKPVSRFEDTSEWKFAKRVIWPKLESYVAQEENRQ